MTFFKDGEIPSCSLCRFATEYVPLFTYPYSTPYCSKGHGQCDVDKFCEDFRLINSFYCDDCKNLIINNNEFFCSKNKEFRDKFQIACFYIDKI